MNYCKKFNELRSKFASKFKQAEAGIRSTNGDSLSKFKSEIRAIKIALDKLKPPPAYRKTHRIFAELLDLNSDHCQCLIWYHEKNDRMYLRRAEQIHLIIKKLVAKFCVEAQRIA